MEDVEIYPLFIPPPHLTSKNRRDWNLNEAKDYRDWLLSVLESRVSKLCEFLEGEQPFLGAAERLSIYGKRAASWLENPKFSESSPNGKRLTSTGYALAADMGLILAKYILETRPEIVRWKIIRKPKSEISFNLPVLVGNSSGRTHLDPIGVSIAKAQAILRGGRNEEAWREVFDDWINEIS